MEKIDLTMAQALVEYLCNQFIEIGGIRKRLVAGCFAIFGHGNVAGLGEALTGSKNELPTYRAQNEQGMALAAGAFAKQMRKKRFMACTTSIGPGATNLVTAAAMAHANRLPLLLLPGDTFSGRAGDPVLQQIESFNDPGITVNDCLKPVTRYFDRIHRPEQIITSLPAAFQILLDPANCGPVVLALPQDVQTMAFGYPVSFFQETIHHIPRLNPPDEQLVRAAHLIRSAKRPVIIAGGGVHYSEATELLSQFSADHKIPVAESQSGKGALPWNHPQQVGACGVTGSSAANIAINQADLIISIGTRLQDFTTGSRTLFKAPILSLNVNSFDAYKHNAAPLIGDILRILEKLKPLLSGYESDADWVLQYEKWNRQWNETVDAVTALPENDSENNLPTDAQVTGAVQRSANINTTIVCAAGGLPGELHKLWRAHDNLSYHLEYGFSTMGYEIAGGLGAKMATPERDIVVMVGDGSYMMLNSEIATSVLLGQKITIIVLDNRGFGCINRLQKGCGCAPYNNLYRDCIRMDEELPKISFVDHARSLGAEAEHVDTIAGLETALQRAANSTKTYVISIDTDPMVTTEGGGHWWEVAIPEVSTRTEIQKARSDYIEKKQDQPYGLK